MRRVIAAALGHRASGHRPRHGHEGGVEERHEQDQHRQQQHGHRAAAVRERAHHVETADHQADEQAAGVAHEDRRRLEVEEQEAGQCAGQRAGQPGPGQVAVQQEEVAAERGGDEADAGRQAVHVVEQVEGVG